LVRQIEADDDMDEVTKEPQAILLLVFNRPDTTLRVFDVVRQAKPVRLYIAADGPRPGQEGEKERCEQVRQIAKGVDWPCDVRTLFRDENLGCRRAVSSAIDWFFEQEEAGIILEDDCVPEQGFFRYAEELLERYKEDERVMVIAALHFHGEAHKPSHSYFFSRYGHCWGWASWRRAWQHYDHNMALWPKLRDTDWLLGIGNGSPIFRRYWTAIFDSAYADKVDSWAYRWLFSCWAQNGLAILPSKNLVTNVGFGEAATHTVKGGGPLENLPLERLHFPLNHPSDMVRDVAADNWTDHHVFRIGITGVLKQSLWRIPGLIRIIRFLRFLNLK
jgi:hypothetical protein